MERLNIEKNVENNMEINNMDKEKDNSNVQKDKAKDGLTKKQKDLMEKEGWDSPEDIIDAYIKLQKQCEKSFLVPDKSDFESWRNLYKVLGMPDSPDGYNFDIPEHIPEGFEFAQDLVDLFKEWSYRIGLTQQQASTLFGLYLEYTMSQYDHACKCNDDEIEIVSRQLANYWGKDYKKQVSFARAGLANLGGQKLIALLESKGIANHPELLKAFAKVGKLYSEDNLFQSPIQSMSKSQALTERRRLQNDQEFFSKYMDPSNSGHKDAVIRMQELNKVIANSN